MTRILLTGATGFVGRQVLRALGTQGADVVAVLRDGAPPPQGCHHVIRTPDLFAEDIDFWTKACQGIDTIVHVAWYAEPGLYQTSLRNLDCVAGTMHLAHGAVVAGVRRFVGIGTCFEFDLKKSALAACMPLAPDSPIAPNTLYGAAKAATRLALSQAFGQAGLSFAWCRLFYMYGEAEDPRRLVAYLHDQLSRGEPVDLSSGQQVRDFMDVREVGRQIARIALSSRCGALNICSGEAVTVAALAAEIAAGYGRPDLIRLGARPDRPDDPPFVVGLPSLSMTEEPI